MTQPFAEQAPVSNQVPPEGAPRKILLKPLLSGSSSLGRAGTPQPVDSKDGITRRARGPLGLGYAAKGVWYPPAAPTPVVVEGRKRKSIVEDELVRPSSRQASRDQQRRASSVLPSVKTDPRNLTTCRPRRTTSSRASSGRCSSRPGRSTRSGRSISPRAWSRRAGLSPGRSAG